MSSKQGFLGLHLTLGITVLLAAGLLFASIAENVVIGGALTVIDTQFAQWLHAHNTPAVTNFLLVITQLHDPITISFMVALLALYLIWKKWWYGVWCVLLVVPGGMLLNLLIKQQFQRTRPSFEHPLVMLTTYSFPSGHVAATTLFYGVLAALLIYQNTTQKPAWKRTACILLITFAMIMLVAFSRLYLGAHYLSDVLAAFLEAIVWLTFCLTVIQTYRLYQLEKNKK